MATKVRLLLTKIIIMLVKTREPTPTLTSISTKVMARRAGFWPERRQCFIQACKNSNLFANCHVTFDSISRDIGLHAAGVGHVSRGPIQGHSQEEHVRP